MYNLFTTIYPVKDQRRMSELFRCLHNNSSVFDQIWLIAEYGKDGTFAYLSELQPEIDKGVITLLPIDRRPTFRSLFNAVNKLSGAQDVNVVANSDIYFKEVFKAPAARECYALTRYEQNDVFLNRRDSQDSWVFTGHVTMPQYCDFFIGTPGCDNRLAMELSKVGYQVTNPSLTIKTYHLHAGEKSYDNLTRRVPPPYMRLNPVAL